MIICLGTTPTVQRTMVFDRLTIDEVNRAASVREDASGKSINVARVLHTLGREVLAMGFLGGDSGRFIRECLSQEKIAHDFVSVAPRTRTCTTVIDRSADTTTELVEEPMPVEARAWSQLLKTLEANLWRAEALVLSGSLAPGATDDYYARCAELAEKAKVPVVIDGRGPALQQAMAFHPLVVKPNRQELAGTLGIAIDSEEALVSAMRCMVGGTRTWIAVTMGAKGAMLCDGKDVWHVGIPQIQVVNPIGSGDSFAAGLTAGIVSGKSILEASVLAAACGVANALTPTPGCVRMEDVHRIQSQVRVEKVQ